MIDTYVYFIVYEYEIFIVSELDSFPPISKKNTISVVRNIDYELNSLESITNLVEMLVNEGTKNKKVDLYDISILNFQLLDSYNKEERDNKLSTIK